MSCNGCRVLRKGCSDTCILRPCLQWIDSPEAQGHATVFVAKFFGRAGLMGFITAVPDQQRSALFQSLLYEACGRTVNPVFGAVGLLWSGNWQLCQAAVDTVLNGGSLRLPSPSSVLLPVSLGSRPALALSGKFTDRVADPTQLTFLSNTSTAASSFSLGIGLPEPTAQEPPTEFRASHHNNDWTLERNSESRNQLHYPTSPRETPLPRRVRARLDSDVAPRAPHDECDHLELDLTLKVKGEKKTSAGVKRLSSPCDSVNSEGSVTSLDSSAVRQQPSKWPLEMSLTPQPHRQLLPLMQ